MGLAEVPDFNSNDFGFNTSVDVDSLNNMTGRPWGPSTNNNETLCQPCIPSMNLNIPVKPSRVRFSQPVVTRSIQIPNKDPKVSHESLFTIVTRAGRKFPMNKSRAKKDFSTRNQAKDQKDYSELEAQLKDYRGYA